MVLFGAAVGVGLPLLIVLSFSEKPMLSGLQGESKTAFGSFGSVASDEAHCSSIGTNIMAVEGGSAVDASIATLLCLGVLSPMSSGLGGGHIMLISKKNETMAEIAREKAPLNSKERMFEKILNSSMYGGSSIAVPGEVAGKFFRQKTCFD